MQQETWCSAIMGERPAPQGQGRAMTLQEARDLLNAVREGRAWYSDMAIIDALTRTGDLPHDYDE